MSISVKLTFDEDKNKFRIMVQNEKKTDTSDEIKSDIVAQLVVSLSPKKGSEDTLPLNLQYTNQTNHVEYNVLPESINDTAEVIVDENDKNETSEIEEENDDVESELKMEDYDTEAYSDAEFSDVTLRHKSFHCSSDDLSDQYHSVALDHTYDSDSNRTLKKDNVSPTIKKKVFQRKIYYCHYCKYCSSKKPLLSQHIRVHTGDKPYACKNCAYKCASKPNLMRHKRTHTGERPYQCFVCKFSFGLKSTLQTHVTTMHKKSKLFSNSKCNIRR